MAAALTAFHKRLQRATSSANAEEPEKFEPKPHNSRRALKHWRQMLDKAVQVQQLLGLEESVHSWLPQVSTAEASLPLSSEQLAEHIENAEKLPPLKPKLAPVVTPEECVHLAERLSRGSNQYAAWVTCQGCRSRWKIPITVNVTSKSKTKKEKVKTEVKENERLRQDHVMRQYGAELAQWKKATQVMDIMASEYASMAMGAHYEENKAYHDTEMYAYAERRRSAMEEISHLEALQRTIAQANRQPDAEMMEAWSSDGQSRSVSGSEDSEEVYAKVEIDDSARSSPEESWVRVKNEEGVRGDVERLQAGAAFFTSAVFVEYDGKVCEVDRRALDEDDKECLIRLERSKKSQAEEMVGEIEDTALPKKTKTQLRKAAKLQEDVRKEEAEQEAFHSG